MPRDGFTMQDFAQHAGELAALFSRRDGAPTLIAQLLAPFAKTLYIRASTHWKAVIDQGYRCSQTLPGGAACPAKAVVLCFSCQQPICMDHVWLHASGNGVCHRCVELQRAVNLQNAVPPPPAPRKSKPKPKKPAMPPEVAEAFRDVGLDPNSRMTAEELQSWYRAKVKKLHPDRHPDNPAQANKRMAKFLLSFKVVQEWILEQQ